MLATMKMKTILLLCVIVGIEFTSMAQLTSPMVVKPINSTTRTTSAVNKPGGSGTSDLANGAKCKIDLFPLFAESFCAGLTAQTATLVVTLDVDGENNIYRSYSKDFSFIVKGTINAIQNGNSVPLATNVELNVSPNSPKESYVFTANGTLQQNICFYGPCAGYTAIEFVVDAVNGYVANGADALIVDDDLRLRVRLDIGVSVSDAQASSFAVRSLIPDMQPLSSCGAHVVKNVPTSRVLLKWEPADNNCSNNFDFVQGWQIEILRLHNTKKEWSTTPNQITCDIDWSRAQRFTTTNARPFPNEYSVSLGEGEGFYIWRVRAVLGYVVQGFSGREVYGPWSDSPGSLTQNTGVVIDGCNLPFGDGTHESGCMAVFYHTPPDGNRIWAFQRSVASETERDAVVHESIQYFDQLGAPRQNQTLVWNGVAASSSVRPALLPIVQESILDNEGRPLLQTLPAPLLEGQSRFGFKPLLNAVADGAGSRLYQPDDFDGSGVFIGVPASIPSAIGGARNDISWYYSNSNVSPAYLPEAGKLIPSAEGYPFARTVIGPDGRVAIASAPGDEHVIGNANAASTTIFYGSTSDKELTSVFGVDAPRADFVRKTVAISPDGQASIMYTGADGNVIATCLPVRSDIPDLEGVGQRIETDGSIRSEESPSNPNILLNLNGGGAGTEETQKELINEISIEHKITEMNLVGPDTYVGTKSIVVTGPTTITVEYKPSFENPWNNVRFDVGLGGAGCPTFCITCDWYAEVTATRVSPPPVVDAGTTLISPSASPSTNSLVGCTFNAGSNPTATFELPTAGTWIIQRTVRFNKPHPGEEPLTREQKLEQIIMNDLRPLSEVMSELFGPSHATNEAIEEAAQFEFYKTYLNPSPGVSRASVGIVSEVEQRNCETISLPSPIPCPETSCEIAEIDFEDQFIERWLESRGLPHNPSDIASFKTTNTINALFRKDQLSTVLPAPADVVYEGLPATMTIPTPVDMYVNVTSGWGVFNAMVYRMCTLANYSPEEMATIWSTTIELIIAKANNDALATFLGLIGKKLDGSVDPFNYDYANGYPFNAYRLVFCYNDATCLDCENKAAAQGLTTADPKYYPFLDQCTREDKNPNEREETLRRLGLKDDPLDIVDQQEINKKSRAICTQSCNTQRSAFERQVRNDMLATAPFTVDEAKLYCVVEGLVNDCIQTCDIAFAPGQNPTQQQIEKALDRTVGVPVYERKGAGNCSVGYQLVPGSPILGSEMLAKYLTSWYNGLQKSNTTIRCYSILRVIREYFIASYPGLQLPPCLVGADLLPEFTEGECANPNDFYLSIVPGVAGEFRAESPDGNEDCELCGVYFYGLKKLRLDHPFAALLNTVTNYMWGTEVTGPNVDQGAARTLYPKADSVYFNHTRFVPPYTNGDEWPVAAVLFMLNSVLGSKGINGANAYFYPLWLHHSSGFSLAAQNPSTTLVSLWRDANSLFKTVDSNYATTHPFNDRKWRQYGTLAMTFGRVDPFLGRAIYYELDALPGGSDSIASVRFRHMPFGTNTGYDSTIVPAAALDDNDALYDLMGTSFTSTHGEFSISADGFLVYTDKALGRRHVIETIRFWEYQRKPIIGPLVNCPIDDLCIPVQCPSCVKYQLVKPSDIDITGYTDYRPMPCWRVELRRLKNEVAARYLAKVDAIRKRIQSAYRTTCLDANVRRDETKITYTERYHHYTLAYYDRAGRRVRTVPPRGVLVSSKPNRIRIPIDPIENHKMASTTSYTSLSEPAAVSAPDAGQTVYKYDSKRRLRFSVDALQSVATPKRATYYKYDGLGRVIETGEMSLIGTYTLEAFLGILEGQRNTEAYPLTTNAVLKEVSRFHFSELAPATPWSKVTAEFPLIAQKRLRGRLSWSEAIPDMSDATVAKKDVVRTYYSYDPHGNKEWEVTDIPVTEEAEGQNSPRLIKRTEYTYDHTLGVVADVKYQRGKPDQFHHTYRFDPMGRLDSVLTSRDTIHWKRDASYAYYLHGPLKRIELGEDRIQGVDYVYTILGDLKAINSPTITRETDPGNDGVAGSGRTQVGKDVFGMGLAYYVGDYKKTVSGVATPSTWTAVGMPRTDMGGADLSLYGGLIGGVTSKTQQPDGATNVARADEIVGERYRYDIIGRLRSLRTLDFNPQDNTFAAEPAGGWTSAYKYDQNGNVLDIDRRVVDGGTSVVTDDLSPMEYVSDESNLIDVVDETVTGVAGYEQDNEYVGATTSTSDANGRVTMLEKTTVRESRSTYRHDDLPLSLTSDDVKMLYLRDAFGRVVRQKQDGAATLPTFYTIPGDVTFDRALYFREGTGDPVIREWGISGLGRIGVDRSVNPTHTGSYYTRTLGNVFYELKDAQGSVRAVVKDYVEDDPATANRFLADVASAADYDAYGSWRLGRNTEMADPYRYMWHGMRRPDGLADPHMYITPFRLYDVRLGRWNTRDPIFDASASPYEGMGSNPIQFTDIFGLQDDGKNGTYIPDDMKPRPLTKMKSDETNVAARPIRVSEPPRPMPIVLIKKETRKAEIALKPEKGDNNRKKTTPVAPEETIPGITLSPYAKVLSPGLNRVLNQPVQYMLPVESWDHFSQYPNTPETGSYRYLFMGLAFVDFVTTMAAPGAIFGGRSYNRRNTPGLSKLAALNNGQTTESSTRPPYLASYDNLPSEAAIEIEQIYIPELLQKPIGSGRDIAGPRTKSRIREVTRLIQMYGGGEVDWHKMAGQRIQSEVYLPNGERGGWIEYELHWFENSATGQRIEIKPANFKFSLE